MAVVDIARAGTTTGTMARISVPCDATVTINEIVWSGWINGGTGGTTTGFIDPWPIWSHEQFLTASTTTSVTPDPWITWNDSITTGANPFTAAIRHGVEQARAANPELEAARRRQLEADHAVWLAQRRQNAAKRKAANDRAETLLMSILSSAQRDQYKAERRFTVHLPNGNHYMIRQGRHGNIERIDEDGKRLENLCVHVADYNIPDADNCAAQKLLLECNEPELRRIANITRY